MKKILLVEDERILAKNIAFFLKQEGYQVDVAHDGEEGQEKFSATSYDLLLLDWTLPKKDGLELCREIRQSSPVPIIMITAKSEIMDRVIGLEVGADDYIVKPFHQRELLARIHALLRRHQQAAAGLKEEVHTEAIILDREKISLRYKGQSIPLTAIEYKLVDIMMKHPQRVYTRQFLFDEVWGTSVGYSDRTVDVNISRLRKKLLDLTGKRYLTALRGMGYRFGGEE